MNGRRGQHKGEASRGVQTAVCVPRPRHHFRPLGFMDVRVIIVLGRARASFVVGRADEEEQASSRRRTCVYSAPPSLPRHVAAAAAATTVHVLLTYPIDRPYRPEYYALRRKRRVMCLPPPPPNKGLSATGGARNTSVGGEDPLLCTLVRARPSAWCNILCSKPCNAQPATAVAFTMQAAASRMEAAAAVACNGNIAPATRPSTLTAVCWYVYNIISYTLFASSYNTRTSLHELPRPPLAVRCRCKRIQFFFFVRHHWLNTCPPSLCTRSPIARRIIRQLARLPISTQLYATRII